MCVEHSMLSLSLASVINTWMCRALRLDQVSTQGEGHTAPPEASAPPTYYDNGFHSVVYCEWGKADAERTVICLHGFARNGRDFDCLAERLSKQWRVICPDLPGRGRSEWLDEQQFKWVSDYGYNYMEYMLDAAALIARLNVAEVDWVGTSLGGVLGILLAAQPRSPIKRLVLNDVGAFVPAAVSEYLASYIGKDPTFETFAELRAWVNEIYGGEKHFGDLTPEQLDQLARSSERLKPQGHLGSAFDPKIGRLYVPPFNDADLWSIWERVRSPVLVLRGQNSFVLSEETAEKMRTTGPRATVVEIPHCGHAPSLMSAEQIATIEEWLRTAEVSEQPHSFLGATRARELVDAQ